MPITTDDGIERVISRVRDPEKGTLLRKLDLESKAQNLSMSRRSNQARDLKNYFNWLKGPVEDVTKEDVVGYVNSLDSDYAEGTVNLVKVNIKKFHRWLDGGEVYPECVRWMRSRRTKRRVPVNYILSEKDILRLIEALEHPRDRAILAVLYDSALRASELADLKMQNVMRDQYGIALILNPDGVNHKTGERRLRLISSVPYLDSWMELHPQKDDPEAPLWISLSKNRYGEGAGYKAVYYTVRNARKRAKFKRKVTPHLLRHSRLTELAKILTEAELKVFAGWEAGSDMAAVYVHLSGEDVDRKLLEHAGKKPDEEKETQETSPLSPRTCPRCEHENEATGRFCSNCSMALDIETAQTIERAKDQLIEKFKAILDDPEVRELLERKLQAMMS
ncbi:MAG: tyrosine-type recombinase/integrase [Thermoplasmata archaeon]|nr:tyrosine-type recombinase/integrase [Thermoplasmata archaeon]